MSGACIAFNIIILAGLHKSVNSLNQTVKYETVSNLLLTPTTTSPLPFKYGESSTVTFNYSFVYHNVTVYPKRGWIVTVTIDNEKVASVKGKETFYIDNRNPTGNISIEVSGSNAGRSLLRFHVQDWLIIPSAHSGGGDLTLESIQQGQQIYSDVSFQMYVTMTNRPIDTLFNVVVFLLVVTANIGMGTQVLLVFVLLVVFVICICPAWSVIVSRYSGSRLVVMWAKQILACLMAAPRLAWMVERPHCQTSSHMFNRRL